MGKAIALIAFVVSICACNNSAKQHDTRLINGYWEIEQVLIPDQDKKVFPINDTYDHFSISGDKGYRTKVKPQLDGTFLSNDMSEDVEVVTQGQRTYLRYKNAQGEWREEILQLSDSVMVLKDAEDREYHYKRTGPINLMDDGEATQ